MTTDFVFLFWWPLPFHAHDYLPSIVFIKLLIYCFYFPFSFLISLPFPRLFLAELFSLYTYCSLFYVANPVLVLQRGSYW